MLISFALWSKFVIALAGCALVIAVLAVASYLHRRTLGAIPLLIHVAGTRGKSATVRYIAAGLRARGLRVVAKTTGTTPTLVLPDGSEQRWLRFGAASIAEQFRFIRRVGRERADAAVVECMAIRPELIWVLERHLIRAQVAVITNAYPDHLEDLGEEPGAMAAALEQAVPRGGQLFVTSQFEGAFAARAAAVDCVIHTVDIGSADPFGANRRLAHAVCEAVGGPLSEMNTEITIASDPGTFQIVEIEKHGRRDRFAVAFACNDETSLRMLWNAFGPATDSPAAFVFNGRRDRPLRSRRLLRTIFDLRSDALVFLAGGGPIKRLAREAGFAPNQIVDLRRRSTAGMVDVLVERCPSGGVVWGVGNYRGAGARLTTLLTAG